MSGKRANIRGSKVVSVEVGKVWTFITIKVPTETVVRRGAKRNPERPKSASLAAKKAAATQRAKKEALLAAAVAAGN